MVARIRLAVSIALFLALILAIPVLAGGWAVITIDKLPGEVVAGEPLSIGFTVRQHGRTPLTGLTPTITAHLIGSTQAVVARASAEGEVGHYTAEFTIPESGVWDWSIQAFNMEQPMPPLTVIPGTGQNNIQSPTLTPVLSWMVVGILGLAGCMAGITLAFRKQPRWAVPLLIIGVALGILGFMSVGATTPRAQALAAPNLSQAEFGKQLFVAKGCTTCHVHQEISRSKNTIYVDVGPNLTSYTKASPELLRFWLKDPASLKPKTEMPNLKLSESEIEALVAFLVSKR